MKTLSPELRKQLERTVVQARDVAETGARVALEALAVQHHEPYDHMTSEQRTLRRRLRAHARQLGDRLDARSGSQGIDHLVHECAYEHWHGMLFARFLAENHLLIEPEMGVTISLEECEELAKEEGSDKWAIAARFAHRMLPQVFRPDHPLFEVRFAREHRLKLESLVEDLTADVFTATDSLGWVYQFWQSKKKDEVNRSEVKIGADELPAVTQLFTEPYMVQFLLHNSLGAWCVSRYPDRPCPVELTYLCFAPSPPEGEGEGEGDRKTPAAGTFDSWPDDLSEFKLLDPCCGSGHFLVAAFLMLVPMRMALEPLNPAEAVDAVLRDNLHGLELDQRCVAIAAFSLALEAWRYPEAGGYRPLPPLNLAWCGQPVFGKREQWLALADGDSRLEAGMAALYGTFRDAPLLGSLIEPTRSVPEDLLTAGFVEVKPLLERALREHAGDEEWEETAIAARGLAEAARLLGAQYHLVVTNVPYLARGKQSPALRKFAEARYPKAKNDLANVFLERCLELSLPEGGGVTQIVMPQNWLFLTSYKAQREHLLREVRWILLARLGDQAFETISGGVVRVILLAISSRRPGVLDTFAGLDATDSTTTEGKVSRLLQEPTQLVTQLPQLRNPDARVTFVAPSRHRLLSDFAESLHGQGCFDSPCFNFAFWELPSVSSGWVAQQTSPSGEAPFTGCSTVLRWDNGEGMIARLMSAKAKEGYTTGKWRAGVQIWGQVGVVVSLMRRIVSGLYCGFSFDDNVAVIRPIRDQYLLPIYAFCESGELEKAVRSIDQKLNVPCNTLGKVPFDVAHWEKVATERYSNGLPKPHSNDPTQWLFHGHPCGSVVWDEEQKQLVERPLRTDPTVLHVAVARLLGYRWPAENDLQMELSGEARAWTDKTKALHAFADNDGIVCLPSIRGEPRAQERLLHLLEAAWGDDWGTDTLSKLLSDAGANSLNDWLRNHFFEQHCKLFHHRPFIWHIWDGRKRDGFHVLVNYHKLAEGNGRGRRLLETLTYSYLGDWIARQQDGVKRGEGGAEGRLAAALELGKRLVAIIEGEPPFDIFVRWKPIEEQPIGWEPDINDGVRLNIRPFMGQDIPGGKTGTGILRAKPNVNWNKDRGKEPMRPREQFPWFWNTDKHTGERVNDKHLTAAEKRAVRERAEAKR